MKDQGAEVITSIEATATVDTPILGLHQVGFLFAFTYSNLFLSSYIGSVPVCLVFIFVQIEIKITFVFEGLTVTHFCYFLTI